MFIMAQAFRLSRKRSVEERMGEAMSEAAVSITITTLTDILAFGISALTPFRGALAFAVYASVSVLFVYFTQVTFCAGGIVLDGRREHANRHWLTLRRLPSKSSSSSSSSSDQTPSQAYSLCCTTKRPQRGYSESTRAKDEEIFPVHVLKKYYTPLLKKPIVKAILGVVYCALIAATLYGCTQLREGTDISQLLMDDTTESEYFTEQLEHFSHAGPIVQVYTKRRLAYWEPSVQGQLNDLLDEFVDNDFVTFGPMPLLWLDYYRLFLRFLLDVDQVNQTTFMEYLPTFLNLTCLARMETGQNVDFEQITIFTLINLYEDFQADCGSSFNQAIIDQTFQRIINDPNELRDLLALSRLVGELALDFVVSDDGQWIEASRFFVPTNDITTLEREKNMMTTFRRLADGSNFTAYHLLFPYFDSYLSALPTTLQNIGIAVGAMTLISLLMIPHPAAALLIVLNIVSIDVVAIGLMVFTGITLNIVSMSSIVICIGIAVDYCAHVTYAFMVSPGKSKNDRMENAIVNIGWPVMQGACTSILSVSVLTTAPSYIYRTICTTLLLVIVAAALHGLVFLPVLLSVVGPKSHPDEVHDARKKDRDAMVFKIPPVSYETSL